ncbi:AbiH family protein [Flavobacterium sp. SUN046]|uniref:AbiH family protein n=1 Tax=Flavobacterium sp. SUN046 TaxID=3002440 RepID=UPI002DBAC5D5|nr:AbiH family protein [Flavobacterium sp. SUN046]MEC4048433.1 AbiH family protein [Flavobacterium sp. SUN046]
MNKRVEVEYNNLKIVYENIKDLENNLMSFYEKQIISIFKSKNPLLEIRKKLLPTKSEIDFKLQPEELLFLNFNYTLTKKIYENKIEFENYEYKLIKEVIHIHGTIITYDGNNVIFGFGDEIDESYKTIENLNDNNYLENIKSIKYLEADNYKRLLEFMNSDDYQVFIFGHSCGISDRTLLSNLFEHSNCVSIKPFFFIENENKDNYSYIIRNISRNFSVKSNMRDKVVNKNYCEALS